VLIAIADPCALVKAWTPAAVPGSSPTGPRPIALLDTGILAKPTPLGTDHPARPVRCRGGFWNVEKEKSGARRVELMLLLRSERGDLAAQDFRIARPERKYGECRRGMLPTFANQEPA